MFTHDLFPWIEHRREFRSRTVDRMAAVVVVAAFIAYHWI